MPAVYPALPGVTSNLARPGHKLLDQFRDVSRVKHDAYRIDQSRVHSLNGLFYFTIKCQFPSVLGRHVIGHLAFAATAGGICQPSEARIASTRRCNCPQ
jgi:hypothetical protein